MNISPFVGRPDISVVIACLNEGPHLETTVASVLSAKQPAAEVIVVDDCSKVPVESRLAGFRSDRGQGHSAPIRVIRNSKRMGAGPSKHMGCQLARAGLVVVLDSHTRPDWDYTDAVLDVHRAHPYAVITMASAGFSSRQTAIHSGANLEWDEDGYIKGIWRDERPSHGEQVACPMGGAYAIGREALSHIGGYAPGLIEWGCEEEFVALRAWAMGLEVRYAECLVRHFYERDYTDIDRTDANGSEPSHLALPYNRAFMNLVAWHDNRAERDLGPKLKKSIGPEASEALDSMIAQRSREIGSVRSMISQRRVRTDRQIDDIIEQQSFPQSTLPKE